MADDRGSAGLTEREAAIAAKQKAAAYVGQVVGGRYRVEALLALGGMGAVFRAEHVHMRKLVALKLLHPMTENLPELVTRFERESIVGSHVAHPNVCQATDFGQLDDGSHYLVLEYVEGRTLHAVLKEGRMAPARAAEIAVQIAAGLGAANELGIVHRDVKPANVMLCESPRSSEVQVKIVDFGLAKLPPQRFHIDEKISVTTAGTVFGTVAYMAPELARGMHAVDQRSDLYAVGVMLYEMLAGKHPFDAVEPSALFRQHCKEPPPFIAARAPGAVAPPMLEAVVRRLLEKEPSARFQTAAELIGALDEACPPEAGSSAAASTRGPIPSARTSSRSITVRGEDPADVAPPSDASPPPAPAAPDRAPARRSTGNGLRLAAVASVVLGAVAAARAFAPDIRTKLGIDAPAAAGPAPAASASSSVPLAADPVAPSAPAPSSASLAPAPVPASGAAPATAAPLATSPMTPEAFRLLGTMNEAAAAHDAKRSAASLLALAKAAPEAFRDRDLIAETAAVAVTVALDRALADDVFALLTGPSLGESGPDVLFHMTSFYGGSRGAARAAELLAQPEVLARASPALRVARELKSLPCKDRPALFDRAAAEGDERALNLLAAMLAPECADSFGGLLRASRRPARGGHEQAPATPAPVSKLRHACAGEQAPATPAPVSGRGRRGLPFRRRGAADAP